VSLYEARCPGEASEHFQVARDFAVPHLGMSGMVRREAAAIMDR
jgi:hypothetical protein